MCNVSPANNLRGWGRSVLREIGSPTGRLVVVNSYIFHHRTRSEPKENEARWTWTESVFCFLFNSTDAEVTEACFTLNIRSVAHGPLCKCNRKFCQDLIQIHIPDSGPINKWACGNVHTRHKRLPQPHHIDFPCFLQLKTAGHSTIFSAQLIPSMRCREDKVNSVPTIFNIYWEHLPNFKAVSVWLFKIGVFFYTRPCQIRAKIDDAWQLTLTESSLIVLLSFLQVILPAIPPTF